MVEEKSPTFSDANVCVSPNAPKIGNDYGHYMDIYTQLILHSLLDSIGLLIQYAATTY